MKLSIGVAVLISCFTACTNLIYVLDHEGNIDTVDVSIKVFNSKEKIITEYLPEFFTEDSAASCTHFGYCVNCGVKFDLSLDCGAGWFHDCPGKHYEKTKHSPYKFYWKYTADDIEYKTQLFIGETTSIIESSECK